MYCICMDAFKPEYYRHAPFLKSMAKANLSGELETILGFSGISVSFFTGVYPDKHGIFSMFKYTPDKGMGTARSTIFGRKFANGLINMKKYLKNERFFFRLHHIPLVFLDKFNVSMKKALPQKDSVKTKTLFDILENERDNFTYTDFPNYYKNRNGYLFFSCKNTAVYKQLTKRATGFDYAHFSELDYVSHEHGTGSEETKACVKELDEMIEQLWNSGNREMLIWSDHGMLDVQGEIDIVLKLEDLDLKPGQDYVHFLDTTMARFWIRNEKAGNILKKALEEQKGGHLLTKDEMRKYHMPDGSGDLVWLADPGFIVLPNFFQGEKKIKAAHGYDPGIKDQKGIYLLTSRKGDKNAKMVDMLPTILDVLKLPKQSCDGKSIL